MKIIITALLLLSILVAYTVPTFYEAYLEHKVLHVARHMASDIIWARRESIKTGKNYGVVFIKGQNPGYYIFMDRDGNGKFDASDFVSKKETLNNINSDVKFSDFFDDKDVVFKDNTYVFSGAGFTTPKESSQGYDSIFLVNSSDQEKGIMERLVRIYINRNTNDIKILRVKGKTPKGDVIFTDIAS